MGVATACDTVSALAPGYDAEILTTGGTILGYWSTGSNITPIKPVRTIIIDITVENMGLSMKKLFFITCWLDNLNLHAVR